LVRLSDTEVNGEYVIASYQYLGRSMRQRLCDMGITFDCPIKIIINAHGGPVLLEVRGTRLALGRGMAMKIEVEETEEYEEEE
jgi:Fe2+ transport system protein FeoA